MAPPNSDPNPALPALSKQYRVILVSDLDWTMVDHDDKDHAALHAFNSLWQQHSASDSLLVFSTGRSRHLYEELKAHVPLLDPDVLICSVGTEIYWQAAHTEDAAWSAVLSKGWDRPTVCRIASAFTQLVPQQESEQRPFKASYHLQTATKDEALEVLKQLETQLKEAGLQTKVVYSGGLDVDILPHTASKGKALEFLLSEVNGDSDNDVELLAVPGVCGCMVSNAHPELQEWVAQHKDKLNLFAASKRCAGGILEGLKHFELLPAGV